MTNTSPFLGGTRVVADTPEPEGFYGPYRGVITNTTDPAGQNRVKAIVPQLFGNASTECDWALPCQPGGYLVLPQPGQGVWITFEGGDINYPVWLGMWQAEPSLAPFDPVGAAAAAQAASDPLGSASTAQATAEAYTDAQLVAYEPLLLNPWGRAWATGASSPITNLSTGVIVLAGFDLHNGFTSGTNSLIVPVAGLYMVVAEVSTGATGAIQSIVNLNGTQATNQNVYAAVSAVMLVCAANASITLSCFNNSGSTITPAGGFGAGTYLHAALLART